MEGTITILNTITIIVSIVSIIALIVFFVMASQISQIKKEIIQIRKRIAPIQSNHEYLAQREIAKGNKEKAIEHYWNYLYELEPYIKMKHPHPQWQKKYDRINEQIKKLVDVI